jgi:2-hydroxychromene-2-carboxylate isomerase
VPEWVPVLAETPAPVDRAEVERRAAELELPAVRWPDPFPFDSRTAMLAATFAKQSGRVVAFSLAAMRQAFAAGRDLSVTDNVLIAAAACELHPRALLKGIELRSVREGLDEATRSAGAGELPALRVEGETLRGRAALAAAGA